MGKSNGSRRASVTAAALLASGLVLSAQQDQTPTFRTGVELVTIDVNVVDRQGQPVRGLAPGDFNVSVAGQARRVVTAEFVDVAAAKALAGKPTAAPISTNEGGGLGRQFVFIVDQSTLETGNARYVARAASRFLSQLTFSDRSALMLMPAGPNINFTWAHDRVREGLQRVAGLSMPMGGWEYGSLAEARDIASHNMLALRSVGQRECGSASAGFGGGGGGFGAAGGGAPGAPQGGAGGGGGTGAGGGGTGGGGGAGGGGSTGGGTGGGAGGGGGGGGTGGGGGSGGSGGSGGGGGGRRSGGGFGLDACMREVQMQAESTWRWAQMTSLSSLSSLRQVLQGLAHVNGDKTVILISGGWPLEEREETSVLGPVAAEAAAARVTLFSVYVPATSFAADRRVMTSTPARDQYLHLGPLEMLAGMTGGASFRAEVNAEGVFDRLGRELGGYYRIGVEKQPGDQDGKSRRMKVAVARGGTTVRAREIFDVRTYEDRDWAARLGAALEGPLPATGVGLRLTSYVAPDREDRSRVKIVLAGEASRMQAGQATVRVLVRDLEGNRVLSGEQPVGEATADGLQFSTNLPVAPGTYIVRVGVMDSTGRVGSVEHRVEARPVTVGPLSATGPLLVRVPGRASSEPRLALDGIRQDERLALELALEGQGSDAGSTDVLFEIARSIDGPALVTSSAALTPGAHEGSIVAHAVADMRVLPAGDYVARAKVRSAGETLGELRRGFTVTGSAPARVEAGGDGVAVTPRRAAPAPLSARAVNAVQPFAPEHVLAPQVLGGFLDRVAARPDASAPMVRELVEKARTAGIKDVYVSDALAAQSAVAAFLRGLTLFSQKKLDPAANAFRAALRASPDFYPAMVYLGACYAAGGRDKEAAGAWQTALIREADTAALHLLLTDALLRQGNQELALTTVERARAKWPEDDALRRRFVVASLLAGKPVEGFQALDGLMQKGDVEEPTLALALLVLYEAFVNERPIDGIEPDRARMHRLADAYRARGGPSLALVETWVAEATGKSR